MRIYEECRSHRGWRRRVQGGCSRRCTERNVHPTRTSRLAHPMLPFPFPITLCQSMVQQHICTYVYSLLDCNRIFLEPLPHRWPVSDVHHFWRTDWRFREATGRCSILFNTVLVFEFSPFQRRSSFFSYFSFEVPFFSFFFFLRYFSFYGLSLIANDVCLVFQIFRVLFVIVEYKCSGAPFISNKFLVLNELSWMKLNLSIWIKELL